MKEKDTDKLYSIIRANLSNLKLVMKSRALKVKAFMYCKATTCKDQDPNFESYVLTFKNLEKHQKLFDSSREIQTSIKAFYLKYVF